MWKCTWICWKVCTIMSGTLWADPWLLLKLLHHLKFASLWMKLMNMRSGIETVESFEDTIKSRNWCQNYRIIWTLLRRRSHHAKWMSSGSMRARLLLKRVQNIWTRGTSPRVRFLMSHKKNLWKIGKTEYVEIFGLEARLHVWDSWWVIQKNQEKKLAKQTILRYLD